MERKLNYGEVSLYEVLEGIKKGKYIMPAFQRQYVWNMERIEKLFCFGIWTNQTLLAKPTFALL